jgi:hypothetical protein
VVNFMAATHKHQSRQETPAMNKHSSLLGPFIRYEDYCISNQRWVCSTSKSAQQSVTKVKMIIVNLVTYKAVAKQELLFNKPASM